MGSKTLQKTEDKKRLQTLEKTKNNGKETIIKNRHWKKNCHMIIITGISKKILFEVIL